MANDPQLEAVTERLRNELKELYDKLGKLRVFTLEGSEAYLNLSAKHKILLLWQQKAMEDYSLVLQLRINLLELGG